jgi:ELWxxDGT repeat protein
MSGTFVCFSGMDAAGNYDLWITDGTAAGAAELSVAGASANGLNPGGGPFNSEVQQTDFRR